MQIYTASCRCHFSPRGFFHCREIFGILSESTYTIACTFRNHKFGWYFCRRRRRTSSMGHGCRPNIGSQLKICSLDKVVWEVVRHMSIAVTPCHQFVDQMWQTKCFNVCLWSDCSIRFTMACGGSLTCCFAFFPSLLT